MPYGLYMHLLQQASTSTNDPSPLLQQALRLPWDNICKLDPPDYDLIEPTGLPRVLKRSVTVVLNQRDLFDMFHWEGAFDKMVVDVLTGSLADLFAARVEGGLQSQIRPYLEYTLTIASATPNETRPPVTLVLRLIRALSIGKHDWSMVLRTKLSEYLGYTLGETALLLSPLIPDVSIPAVESPSDLITLGWSFSGQQTRAKSLMSDPGEHWT